MRRKPSVLVFALLLAVLFVCDVASVAACTFILPPNPWFHATLQFDNQGLPPGVTFAHVRDGDGDKINVTNPSKTPLYILSSSASSDEESMAIEVSQTEQFVTYKVVEDAWFHWLKDQWFLMSHSDRPSLAPGQVWRVSAPSLEINTSPHGDAIRPDDVAIPSPQQTDFTVVYGDKLLDVPVNITYALNPDYVSLTNNERLKQAFEEGACRTRWETPFMIIVGFAATLLSIVVITKWLESRRFNSG